MWTLILKKLLINLPLAFLNKAPKDQGLFAEENLSELIECSEFGLWRVHFKEGLLVGSRAFFKMIGLDENLKQIGFQFFLDTVVHSQDKEKIRSIFQAQPMHPIDLEFRLMIKEEERWMRTRGYFKNDKGGQPEHWMGLALDITDRKRSEQTSNKFNDLFSLARQEANLRTWEMNPETMTVTITFHDGKDSNPRRTTLSVEDYIGRIVNENDRLSFARDLKKAIETDGEFQASYEINDYTALKSRSWLYIRGRMYLDEKTGQKKLCGITLDLTEFKKLKNELQEKKEVLEIALKAAQIAYWNWNPKENKLDFDQEWFQQIDVLGKDDTKIEAWMEALHPEDVKSVERAMTAHLNGQTEYYEALMRLKTKKGGYRHVLAKGKIIARDEKGVAIKFCGFHVDLTEMMELKHQVEEQKAHLVEAAKLASLGLMTQAVRHELNNSLNFMNGAFLGFKSLIQEHCPKDKKEQADQFISIMGIGLGISKDVIKSLKVNSEVSANPKEKEFDLKDVIERSLILTKSRLVNIDVNVGIASDLRLRGSDTAFMQIIMNLLLNSADAIGSKQGQIQIESRRIEVAGQKYVELTVADNGCGMSEEVKSKIYSPFYTTKREGTGLGLFVIKNEIEKLGGSIEVESQVNQGATFKIKISDVSFRQ